TKLLRTKLVGLDRFADRNGQVARQSVERGCDALRRSVEQEHDLADQLFLRRQVRKLLNFRDRNGAAFNDARLELKCGNVLGDFRKRLGQRDRIGVRVSDGVRSAQILQKAFGGSALPCALRQRILHDLVLAPCGLHGATELRVVFDGDALKGRKNNG